MIQARDCIYHDTSRSIGAAHEHQRSVNASHGAAGRGRRRERGAEKGQAGRGERLLHQSWLQRPTVQTPSVRPCNRLCSVDQACWLQPAPPAKPAPALARRILVAVSRAVACTQSSRTPPSARASRLPVAELVPVLATSTSPRHQNRVHVSFPASFCIRTHGSCQLASSLLAVQKIGRAPIGRRSGRARLIWRAVLPDADGCLFANSCSAMTTFARWA